MCRKLVLLFTIIVALFCLSFQIASGKKNIQFMIKPMFNTEALVLNTTKYSTDTNDTVSITTLKFYISNLVVEYEDGTRFKDKQSVRLIDVERLETLSFQLKQAPDLKMKRIYFQIGIDSLTNVSGNLDGDLDPALGMYWAWNSGYINMKLEGKSSSCKSVKKEFQFHIGGYLPQQNALQEMSLVMPENAETIHLKVDLNKWLSNVALKENNSLMIPGKKAIEMAKCYKNMFTIE